jgi:hypothetical protein
MRIKTKILLLITLIFHSCSLFNLNTNQSGVCNVKDFGARGDDQVDSVSIAQAILAIPPTGGVLYFPPGTYKTPGGYVLKYPTTVLGCGMAGRVSDGVSQINCTSSTNSLFIVNSLSARFQNIALKNTTRPTDGAGIVVTNDKLHQQKCDYRDVSIQGFYIGIDSQVGTEWIADNIFILNPVKYGIRIRNIMNVDGGDWCISNSNIQPQDYDAEAAIRIESSGGGKICNLKINCGYPINHRFINGIDVTSQAITIILHVINTSIEGFSGNGIYINLTGGNWKHFYFVDNGIGVPVDASGCAISISSYALGGLENVIISNCVFYGRAGLNAIELKNINNVSVNGCINSSFKNLVGQANCTNIIIN